MKSVQVLFAEGSAELDAISIVNILRRAGISVTLAGLEAEPLRGSRGVTLMPEYTLAEVLHGDYDMIVLPGGQPGTSNLKSDQRVLKLVERMAQQGKCVGAICGTSSACRCRFAGRQKCHQFPQRAGCVSQSAAAGRRHHRGWQRHHFARSGYGDGFRADAGRKTGRCGQTAGS